MSLTRITELADSRAFNFDAADGSATFKYMALVSSDDTNPEDTIYDRLATDDTLTTAITPRVWNNLVKGSPSATPLGGGFYSAELRYFTPQGGDAPDPGATYPPGGPPAPPTPTAPSDSTPVSAGGANGGWTLEIGGEPFRILKSLETISRTGLLGSDPPNFHGLINVDGKGEPQGIDVSVPKCEFIVTKRFPILTFGFYKTIRSLYGKTNDKVWYGFKKSEARFMGASI